MTGLFLTLQNGLGNEEFLARHFGLDRVIGGLYFICLSRVLPGVIEHLESGHLTIGKFTGFPKPRTHDIALKFTRSGVVCDVAENLKRERWRKLIWNIPFNGLSIAAGGITTQDTLQDDSLRPSAWGSMHEVILAAGTCGNGLRPRSRSSRRSERKRMGAYKPSTLLDFEAGRTLEVKAIWGEPLRRAQAAGTSMSRLEQLYAVLKSLNDRRQ